MVCCMNTHQGMIKKFFFYHVRNLYKHSFPMSFYLFGSLVIGFLVVFVLVLLLEGIFVGDILIGN